MTERPSSSSPHLRFTHIAAPRIYLGMEVTFTDVGALSRSSSLPFLMLPDELDLDPSPATEAGLLAWLFSDAVPYFLGDPDSSQRQGVMSCLMALLAMLFGALLMYASSRSGPNPLSVPLPPQQLPSQGQYGSQSQYVNYVGSQPLYGEERSLSGRNTGGLPPSGRPRKFANPILEMSSSAYETEQCGRMSWGGGSSVQYPSGLRTPERHLIRDGSRVGSYVGSDDGPVQVSASQSIPESAEAYSQLKAQYDQLVMTSSLTSPEAPARGPGGGAGGGSNNSNSSVGFQAVMQGAYPAGPGTGRRTGSSSSNNRQAVMQSGFLNGQKGTPPRLNNPQTMQQNFNQELRNLQSYIGSGSVVAGASESQMGVQALQLAALQQPQQLQQHQRRGSLTNDGNSGQLLRSMMFSNNTQMREETGHGGSASSVNSFQGCFGIAIGSGDAPGVLNKVSHHDIQGSIQHSSITSTHRPCHPMISSSHVALWSNTACTNSPANPSFTLVIKAWGLRH